uniref:Putative homing endonuclease n=1 Tax=viral metagenome TaxID=1070528 RepID=A0A6M3K5D7_9ZZZZ
MSANLVCQHCNKEFWARRSDTMYCPMCRTTVHREYIRQYEYGKRKNICPECGGIKGKRAKLCRPCNNIAQPWRKVGEDNSNWKGGKVNANGYIARRILRVVGGRGYKLEHHIVWEEANGKPLPKGWVIHHLNGVKDDNRIENLMAMPRNSHNPDFLTKPYQERIQELELKLVQRDSLIKSDI